MKTTNWIFIVALALAILSMPGIATAALNDGLVAYYPFDGNAEDASGNGHDGDVYDATLTIDRFENLDSAYFFDGVNPDRIIISNHPTLSPAQLSLAAWIKPIESEHTSQIIIHNYSASGSNRGYEVYFRYPQERLGFALYRAGDSSFVDIDFVPDGWHFLVATYDGQDMKLYVDGVLQGTKENTQGYIPSIQSRMTVGINSHINFSNLAHYFAGSIDDVHVYNRALSEAEIQQLFIGTLVPMLSCRGFMSPFDRPLTISNKAKKAIPTKIELTDSDAFLVTEQNITALPVINVLFDGIVYGDPTVDDEVLEPVGNSNDGNAFAFNADSELWEYRIGTKQFLAPGTYTVTVASGDSDEYNIGTPNGNCIQTFERLP